MVERMVGVAVALDVVLTLGAGIAAVDSTPVLVTDEVAELLVVVALLVGQ